ncbi:MAG: RNA ligase [Halobellus sp.]
MEERFFDRLDSTADDSGELFEHFERRSERGRTYHVLPDARHGVERGTAVFPEADAVVRGYPSVPRVLVLDAGVRSFFDADATVAIEEKLDGFNVRIADVGDPVALTRSGYICPYTTARARERLPLSTFFDEHPEKTLCAELIGPETPYTTHDYDEVDSHEFRVFGVRDRESGTPLPVDERRELCEEYGLAQPELFARCEPDAAVDRARDAIDDLDSAGREGIVLKTSDAESMVKYTTESQHHAELASAFSLPFEYGRDFVFSRVIREAFQAAEFDEADGRRRERARDLGESILLPMVEAIEDVADGETVGERQTVRGDPESIDALFAYLRSQGLTLEIESDRREDGTRIAEFVKVSEATRDRIEHYLAGGTRDE